MAKNEKDEILDVSDAGGDGSYDELVEQVETELNSSEANNNSDQLAEEFSNDVDVNTDSHLIELGMESSDSGMSEDVFQSLMAEMDAYDRESASEVDREDETKEVKSETSDSASETSEEDEALASEPEVEESEDEIIEDQGNDESAQEQIEEQLDIDKEFLETSSDDEIEKNNLDTEIYPSNTVGQGTQYPPFIVPGSQQPSEQFSPNMISSEMPRHPGPANVSPPLSQSYGQGQKLGTSLAGIAANALSGAAGLVIGGTQAASKYAAHGINKASEMISEYRGSGVHEAEESIQANYLNDADVATNQFNRLISNLEDIAGLPSGQRDDDAVSEVLNDIYTSIQDNEDLIPTESLNRVEDALTGLSEEVANEDIDSEDQSERNKALQELIEKVVIAIKSLFSKSKAESVDMAN